MKAQLDKWGGIEDDEPHKNTTKERRVHSDCINACNPYHVCAEYCFASAKAGNQMDKKGSDIHVGKEEREPHKRTTKERKVHPDCLNASNPYHVCAQYCFERIAKSNAQMDKKETGNCVGVEDSRLPKKLANGRGVHPDCVNASNPYHVCAEYCFERIGIANTQMDKKESVPIFSGSSHRSSKRKKKGAKSLLTPSEVTDNVPVQTKDHSADVSSTSSLSSSKKGEESGNVEAISSSQRYSEETSAQGPLVDGGQVQLFQLVPKSGIITMMDGPKDIFITAVSEENDKSNKQGEDLGEGITASPFVGSMSSTITDVMPPFEDSDEEGDESMISNSKVLVGKYHVKASNSSILQSIFSKYGDIAASCLLESTLIRSYYLDCVCFVVQELQSNSFLQPTKSKIKELSAILKDAESSQINVGWLQSRLDEITEAMELLSSHRVMREAKAKCNQSLESTRKELASLMEDLAQKEKEVADVQAQVLETQKRLGELELESIQLDESYSTIRSKVENLHLKPISDELLQSN
ncbi:uncharacterized protein LOC131156632 isoform X2 [Malania oleifera]|uniref:uncharacterized protein LOC131156632 isoform X2 n=1 Tax=Malania oleifera TaxID=397392 RepID=UPI0025AE2023|nr:uncharacterized protein LOC131156632 isoform X2 [Malania oleifera]